MVKKDMRRAIEKKSAEAEDAEDINDFARRQKRNNRRSHGATVAHMITENPVVKMVQKGINQLRHLGPLSEKSKTHKIAVDDLLVAVMDMDHTKFETEFETLMRQLLQELPHLGLHYLQSLGKEHNRSYEVSRKSANFSKNLFYDIYPYDDNRVVFPVKDSEEPGYINASYINGYHREKKYIAAQGPSRTTEDDFWRMVWEERANFIIMMKGTVVSEGSEDYRYLPQRDSDGKFGNICVSTIDCQEYADFVITTLKLTSDNEDRKVTHMQCTSWPGGMVPTTPTDLIEFHQKYRSIAHEDKAPTIVHCSAGVGRTGVFIALDLLFDEGLTTGCVDIHHSVSELRHQRVQMVQTKEQYEFLYKLVAQTLALDCRPIHKRAFHDYLSGLHEKTEDGDTRLAKQFQKCFSSMMFDEFEIAALELDQERRNKDRPTSEIPDPKYRPILGGIYINAVFVDSYRKKDGIVLTQMPTTDTLQDFCKLVTDIGCRIIVMLNSVDPDDQSNGIYWPDKDCSLMIGEIQVTNIKEEETTEYIDRTLKMESKTENNEQSLDVRMIQFTAWPDANLLPDVSSLIQVIEIIRSELAKTPETHVLVHCLNGSDQSGVYCVVQDLVERLQTEEEISVITSVRKLKSRRPLSLQTEDQLKFCYQAVGYYLTTQSGRADNKGPTSSLLTEL